MLEESPVATFSTDIRLDDREGIDLVFVLTRAASVFRTMGELLSCAVSRSELIDVGFTCSSFDSDSDSELGPRSSTAAGNSIT